ncbi:alpha/beta hydrolase [Natronorubrum sp. FCH18a]|uniref:alpha/beta hydrolase n=1 Tax=Natronorubrum sp. FCH18a TaxID=3447018 RepID=UPI003F50F6D2
MDAMDTARGPTVLVHREIPFRETDGGRTLDLDVYRPRDTPDSATGRGSSSDSDRPSSADDASSTDRPIVVFVYGGGWTDGATGQFARYALDFAASGWLAVECSYRLADEAAFPSQIVDVHAALDWLGERAAEYGGDPDRLALAGHSAGGHLAALASLTRTHPELTPPPASRPDEVPPVAAVGGVSGIYDFDLSADSREDFADRLGTRDGDWALEDQRRTASPVTHVSADDPPAPTLLLHGADDAVVPAAQSARYRDVLESAGAPVECVIVPDGDHVFLHSSSGYPATRDRLRAFFDEHV